MSRIRFPATSVAALVGCTFLLSPCLAAGAQDLTLAEAERIALERDAMTREMQAQAQAMRERAVMEGQPDAPAVAPADSPAGIGDRCHRLRPRAAGAS